MTIEMDDTDKLKVLLNDAKLFNIAFDAPDVNTGTWRFEPVDNKRVRYALGGIKGTGQGAIEAIVEAREAGGPYLSFFDFCARVDRKRVNKRVVEALIKAGAFDRLSIERDPACAETDFGRSRLLASVGLGFDFAEAQVANASQGGLFDDDSHGSHAQEPPLVAATPWGVRERLGHEKTALGFFLSGHLFDECEAEVRRFCKRRVADLVDSRDPQLVAGIVGDIRFINGQRGRVAIFKLDDKTESVECVANEALIESAKDLLKDDELLLVQGRVQTDRFNGGGLRCNVQAVWGLAAARARFGRWLSLTLDGSAAERDPRVLGELVQTWPARRESTEQGEITQGLMLRLKLNRPGAEAELELGEAARIWPCDEALARVRALAGEGRAAIVYEA